jgi:transposase-like protein
VRAKCINIDCKSKDVSVNNVSQYFSNYKCNECGSYWNSDLSECEMKILKGDKVVEIK